MPQLLFELFQEEIPARMQKQAAEDLLRLLTKALAERGLTAENAVTHVTPRRLVFIADLPAASADVSEELKGPRVSAPPAALDGFLKKTGLSKDQLTVQADPKGDFYVAVLSKTGRPAGEIVAEAAIETIKGFPWPKSMRWEASHLQWVRPLRSILCLFDGVVVPFEIAGLTAGATTRGHRQMANDPFDVRNFDDYRMKLRERRVILDREERKAEIHKQALTAAGKVGLNFREDHELLEEVSGLVEWPVVLVGQFEDAYLDVPHEVLIGTMRANQKYFALVDGAGKLASHFLVVSNLEARDGGKAIVAGNERVLRARLADAKFFWDLDRKQTLESRLPQLEKITFHAKLGTQWDRVRRIERLAGEIAERIGADVAEAKLAARLCKADLVSGTVGEFPEVQGTIGGYLARAEGLGDPVADAIADHYRPQGPSDRVPTAPVSVAVALADKIDTLVGFFAIDEKPTGSKDPFALRRAALGVVRIAMTLNDFPLNKMTFPAAIVAVSDAVDTRVESIIRDLTQDYSSARSMSDLDIARQNWPDFWPMLEKFQISTSNVAEAPFESARNEYRQNIKREVRRDFSPMLQAAPQQLLEFTIDRLKVVLRERGVRHDLIDAVFALSQTPSVMAGLDPAIQGGGAAGLDGRLKGGHDGEGKGAAQARDDGGDLVLLVRRVEALQSFLATDDGKTLLAGYKRGANILRIEEKKDKTTFSGAVDAAKLVAVEEQALSAAIDAAVPVIEQALSAEDFAGAMRALAGLRAPVDAFFETVKVNDDDAAVRVNRLNLLARIKQAAHLVADFSKIEG